MKRALILSLTFILLISLSSAQEFPKPYSLYVNDFAHILNPEQTLNLESLFSSLKQETTAEVVFVSINSSLPYAPQEYRTRLFSEWQIGDKEKDNGLLILYSLQEKRIEVEVGYGLEGILPDSKVGRLLDQYYVPLRDAGNATEGIIEFSKAISNEIIINKEEVLSGKSSNIISYSNVIFLLIILLILLFMGTLMYFATQRKKKGLGDFFYFLIIDFLFRMIIYSIILRGGNSRSSGGGFSGGSFGGGSSGGGGAGR